MTQRILKALKRFGASEDGNPTVEFAIVVPMFLIFLASGIELGLMNVRHTLLERSLDEAMREVRLGTGIAPQHDDIVDMICTSATMVPDCRNNLRLEMNEVDMRNWTGLPESIDCTVGGGNPNFEVRPVRQFKAGLDNEMVLVRACAKFDPFFPIAGLGRSLSKDDAGQLSIVAMNGFVQEPR